MVQWTISLIGSDDDLAPHWRHGIIQTNDGLLYWRMYASPTSTLKHRTFTQLVGQYLRYFLVEYVDHKLDKVWDEIIYPFLNFNGCTVEV